MKKSSGGFEINELLIEKKVQELWGFFRPYEDRLSVFCQVNCIDTLIIPFHVYRVHWIFLLLHAPYSSKSPISSSNKASNNNHQQEDITRTGKLWIFFPAISAQANQDPNHKLWYSLCQRFVEKIIEMIGKRLRIHIIYTNQQALHQLQQYSSSKSTSTTSTLNSATSSILGSLFTSSTTSSSSSTLSHSHQSPTFPTQKIPISLNQTRSVWNLQESFVFYNSFTNMIPSLETMKSILLLKITLRSILVSKTK
jgi:hypothetical protein